MADVYILILESVYCACPVSAEGVVWPGRRGLELRMFLPSCVRCATCLGRLFRLSTALLHTSSHLSTEVNVPVKLRCQFKLLLLVNRLYFSAISPK